MNTDRTQAGGKGIHKGNGGWRLNPPHFPYDEILGSAVDGIAEWLDQKVRDIVSGVQNTAERVANWIKDGQWVTDGEKIQIAVGAAYAYIAAMEEYVRMAKQAVLDDFNKDTREKTDARIYALKEAGIDTADIEAEVARRRQAIKERKKQEQTRTEKEGVQVREAGVLSGIVNFFKLVFDNVTGYKGTYQRGEYLSNVTKVAEVVVNDKDVQPGYANEHGTRGTWCNKALYRMLTQLGVEHDVMLSKNPKTGQADIGWTTANDMAKNLEKAVQEGDKRVREITDGKQAQEWANKGYAVVAAWYNPKGSGHVALVIPDNIKNYNNDRGPKIAQAGYENFGPSKNQHIIRGFGYDWKKMNIKYYVFK